MAQQIINVGTAPNDGLGDPLRTAFEKTKNRNDSVLSVFPNAKSTVLDLFGGRGLFNPNGDLIRSGCLPH